MDTHAHDLGLAHDLDRLAQQAAHLRAQRRRLLGWLALGGTMPLALAGCGGGGDDAGASTGDGFSTGSGSCSVIPEETAGPYPGDGSNSAGGSIANALALSGIVRSDIRTSIAGASGVATGVPLTVRLTLVSTTSSCATLEGYAIYLWHCDAQGRYSMYSSGVTGENYLRGVQATDASGIATFQTVFPGCYAGRMPHMHFEIYRGTASASSYANKLKTSQLAFPDAPCQAVYAASGYTASAGNYAAISFATDNVFSDGVTTQLATVAGDVASGYVATLQVGIAA